MSISSLTPPISSLHCMTPPPPLPSQVVKLTDPDIQIAREEMEITILNKYTARDLQSIPAPIEEFEQVSKSLGCVKCVNGRFVFVVFLSLLVVLLFPFISL